MKLADLKKITDANHMVTGHIYLWVAGWPDYELGLTYCLNGEVMFDLTSYYTIGDGHIHEYPTEQALSHSTLSNNTIQNRLEIKDCYDLGPFNLLIDFEERLLGAIEDFDVQPRNRK